MSQFRRGQNLVLMALTMLLLTLMVLGTLGLSQRLRENHELQNVADAAAYSSAVQNARAFNNIAILNRVQVSLWVAQAADESLISWSSYARASLNAAMNLLVSLGGTAAATTATVIDPVTGLPVINPATGTPLVTLPCAGVGADAVLAYNMLAPYRANVIANWQPFDVPAGAEARAIQGRIAAIRSETRSGLGGNCQAGRGGVCGDLFDERDTQAIAKRVVQNANLDGVVVHAGGRSSSLREIDCGAVAIDAAPTRSGLCIGGWSENMLEASMGSRGNPFVTARGVMPPYVQNALNAVTAAFPEFAFSDATPAGSGYWSSQGGTPAHATALGGTYAWGDDHGSIGLSGSSATCASIVVPPIPIKAHVWSTDLTDPNDQHKWEPALAGLGSSDTTDPVVVHTMLDCTPYCRSVWVSSVGFRTSTDPDAYGQPKVTVLLDRDTAVLPRPWELNFKFRFAAAGPMAGFDNRGADLHQNFAGTNIQHQYALATGISYYHRKNHWVEPPNLLNPYWRATLVASDIDLQGAPATANNDVEGALPNWRKQAYRDLVNAGFQGFQ